MTLGAKDPTGMELGKLAVELGYLSAEQLSSFMGLQTQLGGRHHLGALLVARGALSEQQLHELLAIQQRGGAARPPAAAGASGRASPSSHQTAASPQRVARPGSGASFSPGAGGRPARTPGGGASRAGAERVSPGSAAGSAAASGSLQDAMIEAAQSVSQRQESAGAPDLGARGAVPPAGQSQRPMRESFRPAVEADDGAKISKLVRLLQMAERGRASDVHIHAAAPPAIRVEGQLKTVTGFQIDAREQEQLILDLLEPEQRKIFLEENDLDLAIVTPTGLRCRANVYRTQFGVDATFRLLRRNPPTLSELGLPESLARFTEHHQGMVLVTGPAGSGKSTTLAALVDLLNTSKAKHILSLEDPIEIVHPEKKALVNQRQVGRDTQSFARALRGALREDPDIIVIGELRDRETISLAVTAAETGHLVLGSMHTNSAARTVARILDAFPPSQQSQVRAMVSESLKGIVSQRLVQGVDGKRVPAAEILVVTPAVSNLVREGKLYQIRSIMQTGRQQGMRTLDDALRELVSAGKITQEEAARHMEAGQNVSAAVPSAGAAPGIQTQAQGQPGQQPGRPPPQRSAPTPPPAKPSGGLGAFLRRRS